MLNFATAVMPLSVCRNKTPNAGDSLGFGCVWCNQDESSLSSPLCITKALSRQLVFQPVCLSHSFLAIFGDQF